VEGNSINRESICESFELSIRKSTLRTKVWEIVINILDRMGERKRLDPSRVTKGFVTLRKRNSHGEELDFDLPSFLSERRQRGRCIGL
jgi:hypothetical protein